MASEFTPGRDRQGTGDFEVYFETGTDKKKNRIIHRHSFASKKKALDVAKEASKKNKFASVDYRGIEIAAFEGGIRRDKNAPGHHEGEWISPAQRPRGYKDSKDSTGLTAAKIRATFAATPNCNPASVAYALGVTEPTLLRAMKARGLRVYDMMRV